MAEPYFLAVDVGTSRTGAATARFASDGSIVAATFALGRRGDTVATVAFAGDDGELLFGDAAERRGILQPERLVREFKRSIGDDVPIVVGGRSVPPEHLFARTVADVVATVSAQEGSAPAGMILTHPAAWGAHRIGRVTAALAAVGIPEVALITEPEAAAREYEASRSLSDDETLAVYDLGGGTFDCVLLRREEGAFALRGEPAGLDDLGGADFDDAVLRHVLRAAQVSPEALADPSSDARVAMSQLRRECVDAKEALSFDADVVVPVLVDATRSSVRLTRAEFEDMIDAPLGRSMDALEDALECSGLEPADLAAVLLIGGSSRIPLVAQRLSERFDLPVAIDADPKASISLGAARTALVRATALSIGAPGHPFESDDVLEGMPEAPEPLHLEKAAASSPGPGVRYTIALSVAAVIVAAGIVFGSTMTAGSEGTFVPAAEVITPAPRTTTTPAPTPAPTPAADAADAAVPSSPVIETVAEPQRRYIPRVDPAPRRPDGTVPRKTTTTPSSPVGATKPTDAGGTGPSTSTGTAPSAADATQPGSGSTSTGSTGDTGTTPSTSPEPSASSTPTPSDPPPVVPDPTPSDPPPVLPDPVPSDPAPADTAPPADPAPSPAPEPTPDPSPGPPMEPVIT
ncbi:Hsp70 family protein [Microbacterium sp. CJ88]|uniref:Hsp70 family protein n=1 Tax=Microbacterium sp. CJ88 TaxID=3445672 RepID=UPI003F655E12